MRTHGWAGSPPADDDEAIDRIHDATRRWVERTGERATISVIARELGVTRQTVYRYFPSADALMRSAAIPAAAPFLDSLSAHLRTAGDDPVAMTVAAVVYTLDRAPRDPFLGMMLDPDAVGDFGDEITSAPAQALARSVLEQFPVDWAALGFDEATLAELGEFLLRVIQSFLVSPGEPRRSAAEQHDFLMRWVGPAVAARVAAGR